MIETIFAIICIAIIVLLVYKLLQLVISYLKLPFFLYHFIPRFIHEPDVSASPYYKKRGPVKQYLQTGMWPTIDDPALKEVAEQIKYKTRHMSDRGRASYILHYVQQSIGYYSDVKTHGTAEYWELPINTLMSRKGDCEDSAFLCAALMHLCGLDAIVVHMTGHMTVACTAKPLFKTPFTKTYKYNDKVYYRAETTTALVPYSMSLSNDKRPIKCYKIEYPSVEFKRGVK